MVEVILQLLVCIVDAELLEAVGGKVFEAKNVQDADGQALKNKSVFSFWHEDMKRLYMSVCVECDLCLTGTDSSMSFLLRRAWLIRRTIQSNKALYRDLAMESLAVMAWMKKGKIKHKHGAGAAAIYFYSVYTIWDYLFNYIHIRFFLNWSTEWRQEMTKCWRIIIWHTDTLHVLQWGVKSFNHNIFYFICQQWKWQRLLV